MKKDPFQLTIDECIEIKRKTKLLRFPVDQIKPNSWNINKMSEEEFEKLKESIRITNGRFLEENPIRIYEDNREYIIIDGEHRWRACKELEFKTIPAIVELEFDISKAIDSSVIASMNRGKEDYFKFSKLLNDLYIDKNGKKKCTQQDLANRFGVSLDLIKKVRPIHLRLKNYFDRKSALRHFFGNRHLINLSRVKNDFLREKLIDYSIKERLTSDKIGFQERKCNRLYDWLSNELKEGDKIRDFLEFIYNSIFDYIKEIKKDKSRNLKELKEKINQFIIKPEKQEIILSYTEKFSIHSRSANTYRINYKKRKGTIKGWYSRNPEENYWQTEISESASLMSWDFFNEYYKNSINCFWCGKRIEKYEHYVPHHGGKYADIKWDHLWFIFMGIEQKVFPAHKTQYCHQKGSEKNWKKKKEDIVMITREQLEREILGIKK